VGVAVLTGALVSMLGLPVARRRVAGSAQPGVWLLFGMAAIVLQNLVDVTWYFPALYLLFLFEAGALAAWSRQAPPERGP
jgi:hypothetical protein